MSEQHDDLRATAEDMIEDAEQLKQVEQAKLDLQPADPRLAELANEGERIVRRLGSKSQAQRELASADGD